MIFEEQTLIDRTLELESIVLTDLLNPAFELLLFHFRGFPSPAGDATFYRNPSPTTVGHECKDFIDDVLEVLRIAL